MKRMNPPQVVLFFLCACLFQCTGSSSIPVDISGKWTTSDEGFKGEYIEISPAAVVFGSDDGSRYAYRVIKVKTEKGPIYSSTLFRIRCIDESGNENVFNLIYSPGEGGTLRYKSSQDVLWKKA